MENFLVDEPAFAVVGELSVGKNISVNAKGFAGALVFHAFSMVTVRHERPGDLAGFHSATVGAFGRAAETGTYNAFPRFGPRGLYCRTYPF